MTTTTRKAKSYSDQNKRLNILDPDTKEKTFIEKLTSWLSSPKTRKELSEEQQLKTIKSLLAKQKEDEDNDWAGETLSVWEGQEDDIDSTYAPSLLSDGEDDSINEIPEELSYDTDDQWVQKLVDKEAEDYDTKMDDARENYLSNQYGSTSGGMTNNAFGSKKSGMSPVQQQAMVGLLKDFMSKAPDDPAPQVRGAGIIKGSGTPFPSLLAKKPERPRYVNKGLV